MRMVTWWAWSGRPCRTVLSSTGSARLMVCRADPSW